MNYVRTAILLAGLTALFMGVGYLIGGQGDGVRPVSVARRAGAVDHRAERYGLPVQRGFVASRTGGQSAHGRERERHGRGELSVVPHRSFHLSPQGGIGSQRTALNRCQKACRTSTNSRRPMPGMSKPP